MSLPPGTTLGPYEILAPIGGGGMGEVYRARDAKLSRKVALKVLPPEMAARPERLMRFEREAKAVAALNHPKIVTIHSVEEERTGIRERLQLLVRNVTQTEDRGLRLQPVRRGLSEGDECRLAHTQPASAATASPAQKQHYYQEGRELAARCLFLFAGGGKCKV